MGDNSLRELEHLVLLAIARLEPPAHGVPIVQELAATVSRSISRASVYVVLRRLEAKGLVSSGLGDPTPQRGGRAKRFYTLTPSAVQLLKAAQRDFVRLWAGSRVLGLLLCVCLTGMTTVSAQTRPRLTGTWLNLSDPNATDITVGSTLPNGVLVITHEGDRFHLSRSWTQAPIVETHICDGRENTNGYSVVVERTTCRWDSVDGGTLVIEGTIGGNDGSLAGTMKLKYRLDKDGVLIVDSARQVPRPGGGAPYVSNYTHRYRKVTPSPREARR